MDQQIFESKKNHNLAGMMVIDDIRDLTCLSRGIVFSGKVATGYLKTGLDCWFVSDLGTNPIKTKILKIVQYSKEIDLALKGDGVSLTLEGVAEKNLALLPVTLLCCQAGEEITMNEATDLAAALCDECGINTKDKMRVVSYSKLKDHSFLNLLIQKRCSFQVVEVPSGEQAHAVKLIESAMSCAGMTARTRTRNRGWAAAGLSLVTLGGAAIAGAAIAAHNLATQNPDYEIVKDMFGSDISVTYMK